MPEKWTNPNTHEYRQVAEIFHRRGDGFLKDCDLPELAKIDRLFPCLVRCGGCRFTCAVQDVSHLVGIIEASGREYVRDISMLMNPAPMKPGPYGSWEKVEERARQLQRAVEQGQCDPEAALQDVVGQMAVVVEADRQALLCPVDEAPCDGCAGVRQPCDDASAPTLAAQHSNCVRAAPAFNKRFREGNDPTGHGDICHSDADPGL